MLTRTLAGIGLALVLATPVFAQTLPALDTARPISDPSEASRAEFGRINQPGDVALYSVKPAKDVSVDVEVVVPVRQSNADFRPAVAVLVPGSAPTPEGAPFPAPAGYQLTVIPPNTESPRPTVFEPRSIEKFYHGTTQSISLPANQTTYFVVYATGGATGDFVLGLGSAKNFENVSVDSLIAQGLALKFGLAPGRHIPWPDIIGLLLAILGLSAGFASILAGFLPRPSAIHHKKRFNRILIVTGAVGLVLFYSGLRILFRETGATGIGSFFELLSIILAITIAWYAIKTWNEAPERISRFFLTIWATGWILKTILLVWYVFLGR